MSDVSAWHVDFNVDIYRMKKNCRAYFVCIKMLGPVRDASLLLHTTRLTPSGEATGSLGAQSLPPHFLQATR